MSLNTGYAIRLYELTKKWQYIGVWKCQINDLKGMLGISEDKYKQYGHLKSRVITPSVDELNKKTDIMVSFKEIKRGRRVNEIEFTIGHNQKKEIIIKKTKSDKPLLNKLNDLAKNFEITSTVYKYIEGIAKKIYKKKDVEKELVELVELTNNKSRSNPLGFMVHIISEKKALYDRGENASIVGAELRSNEVVPDWFKDRNKEKEEMKKTQEELDREEEERKEIEMLLAKFKSEEN